MLLKKTNIEERLSRVRDREKRLLRDVHQILDEVSEKRDNILKNLRAGTDERFDFNLDLLETANIYHLDHIKQICVDYRLRFLDTKYFKGKIPPEAVSKIAQLEKIHGITIQGFKIIAPSRLFKLEDKDDPLLFAPLGNGYYYLIHKWGNDLHPLRKIAVWPFKNIGNLALLVLLLSYILTSLVPDGLFSKAGSSAEFWIIFFFMFKCVAAIVIFYGFALGKNFNPAIWNSKYLN